MGPTERRPKRIAFLSEDAKMIDAASRRLANKGVEVLGFSDVIALIAGMDPETGFVLVLDTEVLPRDQDVSSLMGRLERFCGGRPVLVCIAHSSEIELRLQALRAGAEAFFVKPVEGEELAASLLELSGAPGLENHGVLIVDDQPVAAVFAARVLENAGMRARIVGDALGVLDVLDEFRPDLVLMDLNMPGADGIELTALIREHDEAYDTPVVFLSSELDRAKQMDALRVGGNDFIAKPVRPERLVEIVLQGIRMGRRGKGRQRTSYERDIVTGLLSYSAFLRRLDSSMTHDSEQGPGDGLLMIAIDLSDAGTDEVGPFPVDRLMEGLAERLRESLTDTEYAARFAKKRFAIRARRESEGALLDLAHTLRVELTSADPVCPVQVHIGIGGFHPPVDDALTLISRAEKACSQVGEEGGDGVRVCQTVVSDGTDSEPDAQLAAMVEKALRSEGFHLVHQPIMALHREKGERYETSLRLKAPDGEYIPAFDFLPAAQRRGLIPAIDRWVMERVLDRLDQERGTHRRLQFFVHQSMETLSAEEWLPWLRNQIVARDLIKHPPTLQIQFDELLANRALAADRFAELRRLAIKICVDLPEGDSRALGQIGDLDIELVRLPVSVVARLDAARLADLVSRAHEIGAKIIVAQIEDPQTIARVFGCGVDFIQGNFLQRPSAELCFDFSESALG